MTKEKGIIFSGEMVRAILENRKSQTRRVIKPQPHCLPTPWIYDPNGKCEQCWATPDPEGKTSGISWGCPYGKPGDRLWVREKWESENIGGKIPLFKVTYCADGVSVLGTPADVGRQRDGKHPSIHMPRWASRITLEVTGVRVERVQDISDSDAKAEGVPQCPAHLKTDAPYKKEFERVWDLLNARRGYAWNANPWVWVITFDRAKE